MRCPLGFSTLIKTLGFLFLSAVPTVLLAGNLDAPAPKKQPTIRSEIDRGGDIAWQCRKLELRTPEIENLMRQRSILTGEELAPASPENDAWHCIRKAEADRSATETDAFMLGLYYQEWTMLIAASDIERSQFARKRIDPLMKKLGLSDEQVCEALGMRWEGVKSIAERLEKTNQ